MVDAILDGYFFIVVLGWLISILLAWKYDAAAAQAMRVVCIIAVGIGIPVVITCDALLDDHRFYTAVAVGALIMDGYHRFQKLTDEHNKKRLNRHLAQKEEARLSFQIAPASTESRWSDG